MVDSVDEKISIWFDDYEKPDGSIQVRAHFLSDEKLTHLENFLSKSIPDCYISKTDLVARMSATGLSAAEILQNKLPDKGSVMAGDFGEIFTLFYLESEKKESLKKIKKWRFKQDRNKAAPHSDVVILYRESASQHSKNDFVICAEAKLKSTVSQFSPIEKSIEGYCSDKTGRLARTLVWLREKAIDHGSAEEIANITRFTGDNLNTGYKKLYKAVAIVDRNYMNDELKKSLDLPPQTEEFEVIVIGIKDLKNQYENSFAKAISGVST